jgi:archaemetzincin
MKAGQEGVGVDMKHLLFLMSCLLIASVCFALDFKPPGPAERQRAVGNTIALPKTLQRALIPTTDFQPILMPQPGDWLESHAETGQTFDDFVNSKPNHPTRHRNTIYLQPLEEFPKEKSSSVERLQAYTAAYFAMEVALLPPLKLSGHHLTTRINACTGNRQILTGDVLALLKKRLPSDAFCLLAITMEDLYPHPLWNFVFGQASLRERVGVFSFARYHPAFYGEEGTTTNQKLILRRSCKVLVHETAHMFGLKHCIFFHCIINGSNHLQENDTRPLHLCPVCLRKLQESIGFDVVSRYQELLRFYEKVGFALEARWVANRLKWILGNPQARQK